MSVYKRPGSAYYQYDITIESGRYRGSTKALTKADAKLIENATRSKILRGEFGYKTVSLDGAAGLYWELKGVRAKNWRTIRYQIQNLCNHFKKDVHLIDESDISSFKMKRVAQVSPSSVNRELTLLRSICRSAKIDWKFKTCDIVWKDLFYEEPEEEDYELTPDKVNKLLESADPDLAEMIFFSLHSFVRKTNCHLLKRKQINFETREIRFRLKSKKPGGKIHIVEISRPLLIFLANLPNRGEYVFNTTNFEKRWKAAKEAAGVQCRWHDLRHTGATWARRGDVEVEVLQKLLGHSDIRSTMRYAKIGDEEKREGFEKVASHIGHSIDGPTSKALNKKRKSG